MFSKYVLLFSTFKQHELRQFIEATIDNRDPNRAEHLRAAIHVGFDPKCATVTTNYCFLHYIIMKQDLLMLGHFLKYNINVTDLNEYDDSIVHLSVKILNKYMLTYILSKNLKLINLRNYNGDTPLITACEHDNIDAIDILLKNGANIKIKNNYDITVFDILMCNINHIVNNTEKPLSYITKKLDIYIQICKLIINKKKS